MAPGRWRVRARDLPRLPIRVLDTIAAMEARAAKLAKAPPALAQLATKGRRAAVRYHHVEKIRFAAHPLSEIQLSVCACGLANNGLHRRCGLHHTLQSTTRHSLRRRWTLPWNGRQLLVRRWLLLDWRKDRAVPYRRGVWAAADLLAMRQLRALQRHRVHQRHRSEVQDCGRL